MEYIAVTDGSESDAIELPVESDSTLLQGTLTAQFPGATGLRYKAEGSRAMRGLRCDNGKLFEPLEGWSQYVYHVVYPKSENSKRKMGGDVAEGYPKIKRIERKCVDLIALGLPYSTTVEELRDYFGKFGELVVAEIKKDSAGQSKGFGFIRYTDYGAQVKALSQRHEMGDKTVDVKIPTSRGGANKGQQFEQQKIFVGRVPQEMTSESLRMFFSQYCDVLDVYIPKPHRGFGFVTLSDPEVAEQLYDEDIVIDGHSVHIGAASPKVSKNADDGQMFGGGGGAMNGATGSTYGMYEGGTWSGPKQEGYGGMRGGRGGTGRGGGNLAQNMDQLNLGMGQGGIDPKIYQAAHAVLVQALASSGQGGGQW